VKLNAFNETENEVEGRLVGKFWTSALAFTIRLLSPKKEQIIATSTEWSPEYFCA
jgi:hypothetical protein